MPCSSWRFQILLDASLFFLAVNGVILWGSVILSHWIVAFASYKICSLLNIIAVYNQSSISLLSSWAIVFKASTLLSSQCLVIQRTASIIATLDHLPYDDIITIWQSYGHVEDWKGIAVRGWEIIALGLSRRLFLGFYVLSLIILSLRCFLVKWKALIIENLVSQ